MDIFFFLFKELSEKIYFCSWGNNLFSCVFPRGQKKSPGNNCFFLCEDRVIQVEKKHSRGKNLLFLFEYPDKENLTRTLFFSVWGTEWKIYFFFMRKTFFFRVKPRGGKNVWGKKLFLYQGSSDFSFLHEEIFCYFCVRNQV